ncbi:MAG: M20/M25/M40 family metallo-hydrolase [Chloroflexi bacterium]|nr:M20/M25/M40 family metallo-hydrolase [Chloroflexota bacterium]
MEDIFAHIEAHASEYLARLKRACAQPSISAQGEGIAEMADMVAGVLRDVGFSVELVPTDGAQVVLGRMAGSGRRTLLFYNHYDVQPVDPLDEWTTPPFEPDVRDGKLYARGAADNKGAIVARACALKACLAHRGELPVSIVWVIEGEEEVGSPHLAQFVEQYADLLQGVYGCVWEAGGKNARERYDIHLGCKGLLYVELRARGAARDLHSALATTIVNPAWRLLWALNTLKGPDGHVRIPGFYDDVRPISAAQRQALAEWEYPEDEVRALHGVDEFLDGLSGDRLKERLVFGSTCNVDGFHAGYGGPGSKTVLPCEASAKLDFRLVPDQDPARIVVLLRTHLDVEGFDDVEIVSGDGEHPSAGDPTHPFVQTAARAAERVYGHHPALIPMMSGTGPVYLLCGQFGVPVVTAGVGYAGSRCHAPDEHIRIADFVAHAQYVAALLEEFAA